MGEGLVRVVRVLAHGEVEARIEKRLLREENVSRRVLVYNVKRERYRNVKYVMERYSRV